MYNLFDVVKKKEKYVEQKVKYKCNTALRI